MPDWEMEIKKTRVFGQPPETVSVLTVANLGIIFRAETISETLDEFGYKLWEDKVEDSASATVPVESTKSEQK